ncbi:MAG: ion transporter [Sedimenticolaceae bacterium]
MWYRIRARAASILDAAEGEDPLSRGFGIFLVTLIVINVIAVVLESVSVLRLRFAGIFSAVEAVSLVVFSVEYVLRVWSIVDNRRHMEYRRPLLGRLRFMRTPMAIVDLLAVAPFWLSMFIPLDLRFLRIMRLLRVLKLTRYSAATNLLFKVLRDEARVIGAAMFILFVMLVVTASATYMAESAVQPVAFGNIPQAMWWAIVTVTTVGYGDVVPITPLGKMFGAILSFIGVGFVALPAGILASGFSNALHRRRDSLRREVDKALEDGVIDAQELSQIRSHGESLSLAEDEVSEIIEQEEEPSTLRAGNLVCPHCGKALHLAARE